MKFENNYIKPFEKEKMEIFCTYNEKGNLIGQGKINDLFGELLCEGTFAIAPNDGKKSISYLISGVFYIDGQRYEVLNFDGKNGNGCVVSAFTALVPCMEVKVGHFVNGLLEGDGVTIDNVATYTKGTFKQDRFYSGMRNSYRGTRSEILEEYDYFDGKTAKGTITYPSCLEIVKGEFRFAPFGPLFVKGRLESMTNNGEYFEGEFQYNNGGWKFDSGHGKWKGFEGEINDKTSTKK